MGSQTFEVRCDHEIGIRRHAPAEPKLVRPHHPANAQYYGCSLYDIKEPPNQ